MIILEDILFSFRTINTGRDFSLDSSVALSSISTFFVLYFLNKLDTISLLWLTSVVIFFLKKKTDCILNSNLSSGQGKMRKIIIISLHIISVYSTSAGNYLRMRELYIQIQKT